MYRPFGVVSRLIVCPFTPAPASVASFRWHTKSPSDKFIPLGTRQNGRRN